MTYQRGATIGTSFWNVKMRCGIVWLAVVKNPAGEGGVDGFWRVKVVGAAG